MNCWTRYGNSYSIGTCVKGVCLNISPDGTVSTPYNLNVAGVLSKYQGAPIATSTVADMMVRMLTGLITNAYSTPLSLVLPTGTVVYNNLLTINQSIDWSVINNGASTGTITVTSVAGHGTVGNMVVAIQTSGAFRTRVSDANTAITYRMS